MSSLTLGLGLGSVPYLPLNICPEVPSHTIWAGAIPLLTAPRWLLLAPWLST